MSFPNFERLGNLKWQTEGFNAFSRNQDQMIFGSDKGITKYDVNFKKVTHIDTKDKVKCICNVNKVSFLVGQSNGHIQLANKFLSIQSKLKMRNERITEIHDITKTMRDYEYAVATSHGVYFINLYQTTFNQFEMQQSKEEYFVEDDVLGIINVDKNKIGIVFCRKD